MSSPQFATDTVHQLDILGYNGDPLGMDGHQIDILLAWMATKLISSNNPMRYASAASCSAATAAT